MENTLYKKGQLIDLHVHTQYSDGMYNVPELLAYSGLRGLEVLSFTDHDCLSANFEVRAMKDRLGFEGKYINGCEISVSFNGKKYELLAYDFDLDALAEFTALTPEYQFSLEEKRFTKLKNQALNLGFKLTDGVQFDPAFRSAHVQFFCELGKYPVNQQILAQYGVGKRDNLYRQHMIKPNSLFHCFNVAEEVPDLFVVSKKVHRAGGKVVLAHPFKVYDEPDVKGLVKQLYETGALDGFECIHKKFSINECVWMYDFCLNHNLIPTGGSDFHGDGFKVDGKRFSPEMLGAVEYANLEVRFPLLKTMEEVGR